MNQFFTWKLSRRKSFIYGGIFSSLMMILLIPGGTAKFRNMVMSLLPAPNPTILHLPADSGGRGQIMGEKLKWALRLLDKIYIRHFAPNEKLHLYRDRAVKMFADMDPRWRTEVEQMARSSGVEADILMLGNSFLDMGLNASGCRQIHLIDRNGRLLHSHNLDWDNLGGVGNYLVTVFRCDAAQGRLRTVHLAFPGMIGVLDIINEKGVALSFNQLGLSRGKTSEPIFIAMRDIAETCPDFESARKRILSLPPGMPFCIGLTDARNRRMAIYERSTNEEKISEHAPQMKWIAADNMARPPKGGLRPVDRIVNEKAPTGREELIGLLRDPRIMLGCNIYSVIFDFADNSFYLASGRVPAAPGTYRRYELFAPKP